MRKKLLPKPTGRLPRLLPTHRWNNRLE